MKWTSRVQFRVILSIWGGIDRADKAITFYMVSHKSLKWWKKVFFYLLEICFCNSLIIWRALNPGRVDAEQYRLKIVHGLLAGQRGVSYRRGRLPADPPMRLDVDGHYLQNNPKRRADGRPKSGDCAVCSDRNKKRHETQYMCKKCDRFLCPVPCFERFHTLVNFKVDCSKELHNS